MRTFVLNNNVFLNDNKNIIFKQLKIFIVVLFFVIVIDNYLVI